MEVRTGHSTGNFTAYLIYIYVVSLTGIRIADRERLTAFFYQDSLQSVA